MVNCRAFNLDLSAAGLLSTLFKAPEGREFETSATEKVRFEFQATVENCGQFQEFSGSDFTVNFIGSDTSGLVLENDLSALLVKCNGCVMSRAASLVNYSLYDAAILLSAVFPNYFCLIILKLFLK